jgi:hypothetical protein
MLGLSLELLVDFLALEYLRGNSPRNIQLSLGIWEVYYPRNAVALPDFYVGSVA